MKSWWNRVIALLAAILAASGIFLGWTSYNYAYAIRKTVTEENATSAQLWLSTLSTRTEAIYEHIYDLLLTLYNNTELRIGTPDMGFSARSKVIDMMRDKLLVSEDADAFFVLDTTGDLFLFSANYSHSSARIISFKHFVRTNAAALARPFPDRTWDLVNIDDAGFFLKSVQLGKYVVGALSGCSHYNIDRSFNIMGEEYGCFLRTGEDLFCCGGSPSLGDRAGGITESGFSFGWTCQVSPLSFADGEMVLLARPGTMTEADSTIPLFLFVDSALCVFLVLWLLLLLQKKVALPTQELVRANQSLASGQIDYRLSPETAGSREFQALYDSFNSMADQIVKLRIESYDMELKNEQNRLTMLRAQIRPHSFLNVITTISNMTYVSPPEEIRSYISVFAKFVRYMLNTSSPWTTVREELDHIKNYLAIQQTRFPGSLTCTIDCPDDVAPCSIPFLILFTLVENTAKHAMTLYEPLDLHITCRRIREEGFSGISLIVEDSGAGFSDEALEKLREEGQSLYAKEHLGLNNVRYTLNLVYHRSDLLRAGNRPEGGARVEIRIPDEEASQ